MPLVPIIPPLCSTVEALSGTTLPTRIREKEVEEEEEDRKGSVKR